MVSNETGEVKQPAQTPSNDWVRGPYWNNCGRASEGSNHLPVSKVAAFAPKEEASMLLLCVRCETHCQPPSRKPHRHPFSGHSLQTVLNRVLFTAARHLIQIHSNPHDPFLLSTLSSLSLSPSPRHHYGLHPHLVLWHVESPNTVPWSRTSSGTSAGAALAIADQCDTISASYSTQWTVASCDVLYSAHCQQAHSQQPLQATVLEVTVRAIAHS